MASFKRRQIVAFKKFFANPKLLVIAMKPSETDMQQGLIQEAMRNQIEAPAIGTAPTIDAPTVGAPGIGSSSFATEIGVVVVTAEFLELENIQSTAKNLLLQVAPGEGLEVVKDLMVDDDVEVNLEVISSDYGGGLLKWKKGDEKDNDDKKDVEGNVKSEKGQPQTMVVTEVAKIDIVFFNQDEVVGEAYQASADQITVVSIKEQTLEVKKTKDEASQVAQTDVVISHQEEHVGEAGQSKEDVEHNKEEVDEGKDDDDRNSLNKADPEQDCLLSSEAGGYPLCVLASCGYWVRIVCPSLKQEMARGGRGRGRAVGHSHRGLCSGVLTDESVLSQVSLGFVPIDQGVFSLPVVPEYPGILLIPVVLIVSVEMRQFMDRFFEQYFPQSYRDVYISEFYMLEQGDMSISQYDQRFNELSRYVPFIVQDEEQRKMKILKGLRLYFWKFLIASGASSYRKILPKALAIEQNDIEELEPKDLRSQQRQDERPNKGKAVQGQYESLGLKRQKLEVTDGAPARVVGGQHSYRPHLSFRECWNCGEKGHSKRFFSKPDRGPQPLRQFQSSAGHQPRLQQIQ
ncbi:hypothetical protein GIB67_031687 [Kingdonia uniflora]|uniref:Retrotransposon gag domain-containing protein n=1 Tax=Kingdonia uniflora TaxID=39325 RepID=A0A7J7NJY8_9MAGN|nr:hypothetical protein GIB67_031687 [Kingdonia uniflora]